jgi:ATP-dependent DNA helicase RecG
MNDRVKTKAHTRTERGHSCPPNGGLENSPSVGGQVAREVTPLVTGEIEATVTGQVGTKSGPSRKQVIVLSKCLDDSLLSHLMESVGRSNRTKFRDQVLNPLLERGWVVMTVPDKPRSNKQKYRLTPDGRALLDAMIPGRSKA